MAKILVTGGAGYIGSHTVHYLLGAGVAPEDIVVLDNLEMGHAAFVPEGVRLAKVDLRQKSQVLELLLEVRPVCVIHFAGYIDVGESMREAVKYFSNNVEGGVNLLDAMVQADCRQIVFSSSCSVYGNTDQPLLDETLASNPQSPYAESKCIFEKMLVWAQKIHKIKFVILRYFNAAGSAFGVGEQHLLETHLIPNVLSAIVHPEQPLSVFGTDYPTPDGTCVRDYVHVADLAAGHYLAMEYLRTKQRSLAVNLGTGVGTSVMEIVRLAEKITGRNVSVSMHPRRAGDVKCLVADNGLAIAELGWRPQRDISMIMESAWQWHAKMLAEQG